MHTEPKRSPVLTKSKRPRYSQKTEGRRLHDAQKRRTTSGGFFLQHLGATSPPTGEHRIQRVESTAFTGACHYMMNRFQMKTPRAPSRSLHEAFKRAPRSLRGACLREGLAEPPRRLHEPFAEVAYTEGSTKTPWRVREASSKGPWMNCMFLLDDDCDHVWSILYCFENSRQ